MQVSSVGRARVSYTLGLRFESDTRVQIAYITWTLLFNICPWKEIPFLQVGDEFSKFTNKYKKFDENQVKNLVIEKKSTAGTAESYASGGVKVTDSLKREISELQWRKKPSTLGEGSSHVLVAQ